ncbi:hypothetical protein BH24ACI3_BH24ACI3_08260 [soil metagenome]
MDSDISGTTRSLGRFERLATVASIACAVECAARPIALILLPILGVGLVHSEWLELSLLGLAFLFGGGSIALRFRRRHRIRRPVILFALGMSLIVMGHFVFEEASVGAVLLTVCGALAIGLSQFIGRSGKGDCCEFHRTFETYD